MSKIRAGFTLFELAIVMVIVGLLAGGVLLLYNLKDSAEAKAAMKQLVHYDSSIEMFQARYNQLPGDSSQFNGIGNNNEKIEDDSGTPGLGAEFSGEVAYFWVDMEETGTLTYAYEDEEGKSVRIADNGDIIRSNSPAQLEKLETAVANRFTATITDNIKVKGDSINVPASPVGIDGTGIIATNDNMPLSDADSWRNRGLNGIYIIGKVTDITAADPAITPDDIGDSLTPSQLATLDEKFDDGVGNTGKIQASSIAGTCLSGSNYDQSVDDPVCSAAITLLLKHANVKAASAPVGGGDVCGDGSTTGSEQCDDGNTDNGDGCDSSCQIEEICGDMSCTGSENAGNCPGDCGESCGDGFCTHSENASSCSNDCPENCGDFVCTGSETCGSCPGDCGGCGGWCGDMICDGGQGEDCSSCPSDCGSCCGNGTCDSGYTEDCSSCSQDCGACGYCGDTICDSGIGEDIGNCPGDCGGGTICGDFSCDMGEDCNSCSNDCGSCCGNGVVDGGEDCDDGGTSDGDGCSASCTNESSICGNGALESGEGCDDGGVSDGDGCNSSCQSEYCTDGICNNGEDCSTCDQDCGSCGPTCGDTFCDPGEDCSNCSNDCGGCAGWCGDGVTDMGESCDDGMNNGSCGYCDSSCSGPTSGCDVCGDGSQTGSETCDSGGSNGTCGNCNSSCNGYEAPCGPTCGDMICEGGEDCTSCSSDCGSCGPTCGDMICDGGYGEDCNSCSTDCGSCGGSCTYSCGNGTSGCTTGPSCDCNTGDGYTNGPYEYGGTEFCCYSNQANDGNGGCYYY